MRWMKKTVYNVYSYSIHYKHSLFVDSVTLILGVLGTNTLYFREVLILHSVLKKK